MGDEREKPTWWRRNEANRESMDLPAYEPPRFEDGVYVHEIVSDLESEYGCEILLLGVNVAYPDDWSVRIDGDELFSLARSLDESGNTIYHIDSSEFISKVNRSMVDSGNPSE